MPSQIFDDGYGVYEVPSGERLVFRGGEGADASYNLPSSFDKAKSPQRGRTWGSSDRFTSPGSYLRKESAPGPGAYTANEPGKPMSRFGVLGPERQGSTDRLKFEGVGEGADAVYAPQSAFDRAASPSRTANGFGASQRFGKVNSYVSGAYTDSPGPGAYTQAPGVQGDIYVAPRSSPAPPRNTERLNFAAIATSGMGESPGPAYKVDSAFDQAAEKHLRGSTGGFGKSNRFDAPGSYLRKEQAPGPGAYSPPSASKVARPASAPRSFRQRSVDFGPAGEGADPSYSVRSTFDKASARDRKPSSSFGTTPRFDKHGSYASKAASTEPGPGAYKSPSHRKGSTGGRPSGPPPVDKGRVDFGPVGEGVAAIYDIRSSFDKQPGKVGPTSCFGSSNRFDSPGSYAKPTVSPGPGAYAAREEVVKQSAPKASFASPKMRPPGYRRPRSALNSSSNSYLR